MASIKLKHSGGNGTILNSPAANPSSDVTLKLPSTTGSAGQVLKVASANHSSTNAELEFGGGVITEADSWRVNSDFSAGTGTNVINTNWERDDTDFEKIGTGLSHDGSGKFGFQVTGKYLLTFFYSGAVLSGNDARYAGIRVYVATDGISGTYNERAISIDSVNGLSSSSTYAAGSIQKILDVTNTNTYFYISTYTTGSITWRLDGATDKNQNGFTSIRLGDT